MATKRLYRSNRDRVLGGVAGGLGEYFDVDATLVRLAWILLALSGVGVLAYIIAWIFIPEAPWRPRERERSADSAASTGPAASEGSTAHERSTGSVAAADYADGEDETSHHRHSSTSTAWLFGVTLIGVGGFLLLRNFWPALWSFQFWPIVLIFVGALLLVGAFRR